MNRQERRHQERLTKKQGKEASRYTLDISLIQPWSVPVVKTTLPPDVLQTMIEISDEVIANKDVPPYGEYLVGQIEKELLFPDVFLNSKLMDFFNSMTHQFGITCKCQAIPDRINEIKKEEWLTKIVDMWIVSQQPGEYNPLHVHKECQISSVMYLKVPKMLPSRKEHRPHDDGSISFVSNASRDLEFSAPSISIPPQVGDFFIFGANQQHLVYPYRCEEGQEDVERRSVSFNTKFYPKT